MNYNVQLNIDQLVLNGFASKDRHNIKNSINIELNRLFTEQGIPGSLLKNRITNRMQIGEIKAPANSQPHKIGTQVAQKIYSALKNG